MAPLLYSDRLRDALRILSQDRLAAITERLGINVNDRRPAASLAESIARAAAGLTTGDILGDAKRSELKEICERLGLDGSGKEKGSLLSRIASALGETAGTLTLKPSEPTQRKASQRRKQNFGSRNANGNVVTDYRFPEATRKNNPPAGLVEFDKPPPKPTKKYSYDPYLDPQLQWTGKAEHTSFQVDTVSLHIHEQVSAQAMLKAFKRDEAQRSLFGEPDLPESKQVDFYQHEVGWRNRLILGDSLLVMNSLLEREQLAAKVQCIYFDPPYGVNYRSNFQPAISRRDFKEDDAGLTREPETIQAYRDTWTLGVHSYLAYLRDRLLLCRDLLTESGSIFVQISDANVHHVRELLDEIFGPDNFHAQINFKTSSALGQKGLAQVYDYIVWYCKNSTEMKFRPLFKERDISDDSEFRLIDDPDSPEKYRKLDDEEFRRLKDWNGVFSRYKLTSAGFTPSCTFDFEFQGQSCKPYGGKSWATNPEGMRRLIRASRLFMLGGNPRFKQYYTDFPVTKLNNSWSDQPAAQSRVFVVQTATKFVQRCILMSTDPGDLVLDPTCGSGTTAYVAEQWGRRWVTCDTSRVALAIARQRLLTAKFPYYCLRSDRVRDGFVYKTVPHITLESIAQNRKLDVCKTNEEQERVIRESGEQEILYDQPEEDKSRVRVTGPFTVEAIPVAVMEDPDACPSEGPSQNQASDASVAHRVDGDATNYVEMMLDLLRKTGVQFPKNKRLPLSGLHLVQGSYEWLHAEGGTGNEGDPRRVAISFGPRHGPVTPTQVLQAIQETRGYDIVLLVGFALDPEAGKVIDKGVYGRELHFVAAASDILVGDLLKTTHATKLFTVFGAPDVTIKKARDGDVQVELRGVDLYDPSTGETHHDKGVSVAAWFLDQDYDGKTFCICQAFFPGGGQKHPWEKLQRALKGYIEEDKFEALRGTTSLPFKPGKRLALKVIDDRGNEVIKVVDGRP